MLAAFAHLDRIARRRRVKERRRLQKQRKRLLQSASSPGASVDGDGGEAAEAAARARDEDDSDYEGDDGDHEQVCIDNVSHKDWVPEQLRVTVKCPIVATTSRYLGRAEMTCHIRIGYLNNYA